MTIIIINLRMYIANAIKDLEKQLDGNLINAVIDGSSGNLFSELPKVLQTGAIIAQYGDTAQLGGVKYNVDFFIKNVELRGTTMGSHVEFGKMVEFVGKHKIKPVVSQSFKGLTQENFEESVSLLT